MHFELSQAKRRAALGITQIATGLFLTLVFLDLLTYRAWQGDSIVKTISYSFRWGVSIFALAFCAIYLARLRGIPLVFTPTALFCGLVVAWFFIWLIERNAQLGWVAILLNPSYSLPTWMLILWIMLSSVTGVGRAVLSSCTGPFRWFALLSIVIATTIEIRSPLGLYLPSLSILVLYAAIARPINSNQELLYTLLGPAVVLACMAATGYRTYMLAAILVWPLRLFLSRMSRWRVLLVLLGLFSLPFVYAWIVSDGLLERLLDQNALLVDTRTFLFQELWDDYSFQEILIGRGIDGTYYSPYFYALTRTQDLLEADYYIRSGSEVGWINIIIKFGFVGLFLFLGQILLSLWTASRENSNKDDEQLGALRFVLLMLFIFCIELPASITAPYVLWYVAVGHLLRRASGVGTRYFRV
ncbi:hypothetical protein [Ideonella alba]|uniref:Uncharacterized protein n=1 Tax=Ideonella alba TaxID=2824118 RepID=A0A940Y5P5_9BURK|nr:hypothetical protein [Ideonella alba]MBQ0929181.1 hypothetical protein [Ideonella alba]